MPVLPVYEFDYYTPRGVAHGGGSILREERANEDAKIQLDVDTHRHVCREETRAMVSSPSPSPRRSFSASYYASGSAYDPVTSTPYYSSSLAGAPYTQTYTSSAAVRAPRSTSEYYYEAPLGGSRMHYEQGYADGLTGSPRRYY